MGATEDNIKTLIEQRGIWWVGAVDGKAPFAYTVGLHRLFQQPEILLLGVRPQPAMGILNNLGNAIRGGARFSTGQRIPNILAGDMSVGLRSIASKKVYRDYLGYALWFYGGDWFPVVECMLPDEKNVLPTEASFDGALMARKPLPDLWQPRSDLHGRAKVLFRLVQNEQGFPPATIEGMWADRIDDAHYRLDNIPFYARSVARGDVVAVKRVDGELWFDHVTQESGHGTIRVIVYDEGSVPSITSAVQAFGCTIEPGNIAGYFAVDVPPNAKTRELLRFLEEGEEGDRFSYEEGCKTW